MNKPILIHKNNTKCSIDNLIQKSFDIPTDKSDNIDGAMSDFLDTQIFKEQGVDVILIKDSLSENYLDFYGLLLAYHIRLSDNDNMKYLPIVIISDLTIYQLNKLTPLAKLFNAGGIYLVDNNLKKIDKILGKSLKKLEKNNFKNNFLNLINIEPSASYSSHHSIANEWAIYQWAKFLKVSLDEIQNDVSAMLYFKYLKAIYDIKDKKSRIKIQPKKPTKKGQVLLIDDEWEKGWNIVFESFLGEIEGIDFKVIEKEFKDKNSDEVCSLVSDNIDKENLPDTIILDLRLADSDFDKDINISDITGIKLIRMIQNINPGIQIILWTASGDSNILNEVNEYNILGYIKKEYPGDRTADVNNSIKNLTKLIDNGFKKSYLKEIWDIQNEILGLEIIKNNEYAKIKPEAEAIFNILDSGMKNRLIYSMFTICKSLEIIKDNYFGEEKIKGQWKAYWKNIEPKTYISGYSTEDRLKEIILKIKMDNIATRDRSIKNIFQKRNNIIHPKNGVDVVIIIMENDILTWFKMLQDILSNINEKSK